MSELDRDNVDFGTVRRGSPHGIDLASGRVRSHARVTHVSNVWALVVAARGCVGDERVSQKGKGKMMSRRLIAGVIVGGLVALLAGSVPAQDAKKPDATVKLSEGTVAAGIGWSWGKGTLTYKGKTSPFKVEGLSVGDVGITKAQATGNVFNLKKVEDFSGIYRAAAVGGTAVKGAGATALQNEKGVVIELKSATKGAELKVALEGLKLALEK